MLSFLFFFFGEAPYPIFAGHFMSMTKLLNVIKNTLMITSLIYDIALMKSIFVARAKGATAAILTNMRDNCPYSNGLFLKFSPLKEKNPQKKRLLNCLICLKTHSNNR